jgi:hypothetical protein
MTQQQLIQRLKQQPKQGMPMPSWYESLSSGIEQTGQALSTFTQYGTQATQAIAQIGEAAIKTGTEGFAGLLKGSVALNTGLAKVLDINTRLQDTFLNVASAASIVEKRNSVLNKGFGITSKQSELFTNNLKKLSKEISGNSAETQISLAATQEYAVSIKKLLPTLNQAKKTTDVYYQGLQQSQFILRDSIGLSEEQANAYTQFAGANATNAVRQLEFSRQVAEALGDDGSMGYLKIITEGIAEAGADIQLQYGRLPGSLEVATVKASRLGLKLEDLASAGESLLDIESSIGKELEYQLLTGRQLTNDQGQSLTNLYREATLRGNASDQADILNKIVQEEGETLSNNLFARKQMADLLGIQEQQLAGAIQKQKILEKAGEAGITLDIDDDGAIAAAANELKKQGILNDREFKEFQDAADTRQTDDILKEQLQIAQETLIYDRMNATVMSMRTDLTKAAERMAAATAGTNLSEEQLKSFGTAMTVLAVPSATAKELEQSIGSTISADKQQRGGKTGPSDDLIATPTGYGDRILLAGEDTFALNNDDTVVAGTNLFPKQSSGNSSLAAKMDELIAEIRTQTRVLSKRDNTFGAGINSAYYG